MRLPVIAGMLLLALTGCTPATGTADEPPMNADPALQAPSLTPSYRLALPQIPEGAPQQGRYVEVLGTSIHYVDLGQGSPIVFLHGNPTSSYLWRNILAHVSEHGRAIALDLVGMGASGKPQIAYGYADHYRHLQAFIDALGLRDITFVVHDWGATLGFDYASRNPARVKRIAFMEGVLPPIFPQPSFEAMGEEMGGIFRALKDPLKGRELVIERHMFVEEILPNFVNRPLGANAMSVYRAPYHDPRHRAPLLAWPRAIPIAGEPADVVERMSQILEFMRTTEMPMLLLYAEPGVLVPPPLVNWYVQHLRNLETVFVGQGLHFIQEDQPVAIGRALRDWLRRT